MLSFFSGNTLCFSKTFLDSNCGFFSSVFFSSSCFFSSVFTFFEIKSPKSVFLCFEISFSGFFSFKELAGGSLKLCFLILVRIFVLFWLSLINLLPLSVLFSSWISKSSLIFFEWLIFFFFFEFLNLDIDEIFKKRGNEKKKWLFVKKLLFVLHPKQLETFSVHYLKPISTRNNKMKGSGKDF